MTNEEKARKSAYNRAYLAKNKQKLQEYQRAYRKANRALHNARTRRDHEATRLRLLEEIGKSVCKDCGHDDVRVLEFDHVRGEKGNNIARLIGKKWETLLEEANKCEVVCANCHVLRTKGRIKDKFQASAIDQLKPVGIVLSKTHFPCGCKKAEENKYYDNHGRSSCWTCRRIKGRKAAQERRNQAKAQIKVPKVTL